MTTTTKHADKIRRELEDAIKVLERRATLARARAEKLEVHRNDLEVELPDEVEFPESDAGWSKAEHARERADELAENLELRLEKFQNALRLLEDAEEDREKERTAARRSRKLRANGLLGRLVS